jgi:hypothetical protein
MSDYADESYLYQIVYKYFYLFVWEQVHFHQFISIVSTHFFYHFGVFK